MQLEEAYFAGGCFWGVEYHFSKKIGVTKAISGYIGGDKENPTYEEVCTGLTGHLEVVKIEFDNTKVSFEELLRLFFEIHDFTQTDGQGPDIGSQYLSAIFYLNEFQKNISNKIISELLDMNYQVATKLYSFEKFFEAEEYHQNYYERHQKVPYCHSYKKIF